jgi:VWFA-related protein
MAIGRLLGVGVGLLAWLVPPGASSQDRYRTALDLVSIYATVTDAGGRLVPDLTQRDFTVKDNGRKQPIAAFSNDAQPLSVVVLLDCSGSMAGHLDTLRDSAAAFLTALRSNDRARLGTFAGEIRLEPEVFTNDRERLLTLARTTDLPAGSSSPIWTAIDRSITALLSERGRRVVLVFTDGINQTTRGEIVTDLKDIIWRARVDDVMVYAIGFTGSGDRGPYFALPGRSPTTIGGSYGWGGVGGAEAKEGRKALQELTTQTGGGFFEMDGLDRLTQAFARVAEELHRQYWIGIKAATLDDTMHKLEVSVSRRDLTVQARKSYFAGSFVK